MACLKTTNEKKYRKKAKTQTRLFTKQIKLIKTHDHVTGQAPDDFLKISPLLPLWL